MKTILTNCVIYCENNVFYNKSIVIENDKISAIISDQEIDTKSNIIDLKGANISAGFIDLQLNGCGGVMFNSSPTIETIQKMHETNLKSGTTSFLPTLITTTNEEMKKAINSMNKYLELNANTALGLHLEGPYISVEKKGTHNPQLIREIDQEMLEFILTNRNSIKKITLAPENKIAKYIPQFIKNGIVVSIGHSNATFAETKSAIKMGASFATHLHNAMSPISSGRDLGVVGAVLDSDIYAGIIADGLHVDFANIRIAKNLKGNKLCLVTDAVAAAGSDIQQFDFVGKTIYVRDGNCYDANGIISGSSLTMIEAIKNCVEILEIPLAEALRMATVYPARAVGVFDHLGSIASGKIANLVVFDHKFSICATIVNGKLMKNS